MGDECVPVPANKNTVSVNSPGFARVSKIEGVSAQGNARNKGNKNPRKMVASEANIVGLSE
jgi:hypothetical protein